MCTVLCVATSSSEFWSTQRILKADILPSVDILLSRIIACVGTEGFGVGGFGCQRLKVSSLSQAAHQSHQSSAHINIKTMQRHKKMLKVCSKCKISNRLFLERWRIHLLSDFLAFLNCISCQLYFNLFLSIGFPGICQMYTCLISHLVTFGCS